MPAMIAASTQGPPSAAEVRRVCREELCAWDEANVVAGLKGGPRRSVRGGQQVCAQCPRSRQKHSRRKREPLHDIASSLGGRLSVVARVFATDDRDIVGAR